VRQVSGSSNIFSRGGAKMPTQASQAALNGYFHFYVAVILVIGMKTDLRKILAIGLIYSVPILMNVIGKGIFHWAY